MSSILVKNLQIGADTTATNNFTIYQPATPNGTLLIGNGNTGITSSLVALTSAGNLGIGTSSPSGRLTLQNASVRAEFGETSGANYIESLNNARTDSVPLRLYGLQLQLFTKPSGGAYSQNLTLDSSGNLGLGVTPSASTSNYRTLQIGGAASYGIFGQRLLGSAENFMGWNAYGGNNTTTVGTGFYYKNSGDGATMYSQTNFHSWWVAPSGTAGNAITFTQAMTLDAGGNLLVGTTTALRKLTVESAQATAAFRNSASAAGKRWDIGPDSSANAFIVYNQNATGVYIGDGATAWTANSDERLKENLIPITDAANKVSSLRAVTGNYISDTEKRSRAFLIAQDVQKVLPEAVDATNPEKLGVQYTDVIPLLVAAIKEQQALILALQAQLTSVSEDVAALKAAA